jgi:hypothetical protein
MTCSCVIHRSGKNARTVRPKPSRALPDQATPGPSTPFLALLRASGTSPPAGPASAGRDPDCAPMAFLGNAGGTPAHPRRGGATSAVGYSGNRVGIAGASAAGDERGTDAEEALSPECLGAALDAAYEQEQGEGLPLDPGSGEPIPPERIPNTKLLFCGDYDLNCVELTRAYITTVVPAKAPPPRMGNFRGALDINAILDAA